MLNKFFVCADGARLAYRDEGHGTPLLCLPGLTRTIEDFRYALPFLTANRVIRMDYRGRGASDWTGAPTYTILQEAQDALALLDHLAIDRFALLGTSRGGLIGLLMAVLAPNRLIGLCLNDIGPAINRPGLDRIAAYVGRNPTEISYLGMADVLARTNTGFDGVPKERWLEEARLHYRLTDEGRLQITYDPALREAFLQGYNAPEADLWPLFDQLAGKPVAVIRGQNSDLLTAETLSQMQVRRPDMITAVVPDRGHIPFLDEPESQQAILGFLRACDMASAPNDKKAQ